MYKVIIADDERIIREGIQKVVPWRELNCCLCGIAKNGKEAYQMACKYKPDLMIMDIRMPEMDGLKVIEKLQERIECQFILLSGYEEFEYARKALELRIVQYLLKPVDIEQLESVIKSTLQEIEQMKIKQEKIEKVTQQMEDSIHILKDKFIGNLLFDPPRISEDIYEELEYYGIELRDFRVLVAEVDMNYQMKENFQNEDTMLLLFLMRERMEEILIRRNISFQTYLRGIRVYMLLSNMPEDSIGSIMQEIGEEIEKNDKFTVSLACSEKYQDVQNLKEARWEVEHILAEQRLSSQNQRVIQDAVNYLKENYQKDISMDEVAEAIHLSKWYFSKIFKKEMGVNWSEFLVKYRMQKAQELINKMPTLYNYEVAEKVGYTDVRYFSQLFRKITGMTPSEYRKAALYEKTDL